MYVCVVCACVGEDVCVPQHTYGSQGTSFRTPLSPFIVGFRDQTQVVRLVPQPYLAPSHQPTILLLILELLGSNSS